MSTEDCSYKEVRTLHWLGMCLQRVPLPLQLALVRQQRVHSRRQPLGAPVHTEPSLQGQYRGQRA